MGVQHPVVGGEEHPAPIVPHPPLVPGRPPPQQSRHHPQEDGLRPVQSAGDDGPRHGETTRSQHLKMCEYVFIYLFTY